MTILANSKTVATTRTGLNIFSSWVLNPLSSELFTNDPWNMAYIRNPVPSKDRILPTANNAGLSMIVQSDQVDSLAKAPGAPKNNSIPPSRDTPRPPTKPICQFGKQVEKVSH